MHPRNVACPVCGAGPGMPCLNAWGYPVTEHHQARVERARR
jgi:hypothetical protein